MNSKGEKMASSGSPTSKGEGKDPTWPKMPFIRNTQTYTGDIIKFFRHFRVPQHERPYSPAFMEQRREWTLRQRKLGDQWRPKYLRRVDTFRHGFYCPDSVPFLPLGGHFLLDPTELILTTLADSTDPRAWLTKDQEVPPTTLLQLPKIETQPERPRHSIFFPKSLFPRAGYASLKEGVQNSEQRVQACSIGMTYSEIVEKMRLEELARQPKVEGGMVLVSLSDLCVLALQEEEREEARSQSERDDAHGGASEVSIEIVAQEEDDLASYAYEPVKTLLLDTDRCAMTPHSDPAHCAARTPPRPVKKSPSTLDAGPSSQFPAEGVTSASKVQAVDSGRARNTSSESNTNVGKGNIAHNQILELYRERVRRETLEFLWNIHRLLVAIYNMRSKMLRNKVPLSRPVVQELMREKFGKLIYQEVSLGNLAHVLRRPSCEALPPWENPVADSPSPSYNNQPGNNALDGRRRGRARCETWEELLNCSTTNTPTEISSSSPSIQTAPKSSRYRMLHKKKDKPTHSKDKCSLWQYVAMEKPDSFFDPKKKAAQKRRPENVVRNLREAFEVVKEKTVNDMRDAIRKKDRDKLVNFKFKYLTAWDNLLSGDIFEFQQRRMRSAVRTLKDRDPVAVPQALWFDEIRERVLMVLDVEDPEYREIMHKLMPLSNFSIKTSNFLRAKLCLLVMSLPAFDLCQITVQSALEFVMGRILGGCEDTLHQWIHQRKLPVVTGYSREQPETLDVPDE